MKNIATYFQLKYSSFKKNELAAILIEKTITTTTLTNA